MTTLTKALGLDISIYYGETIINNNDNVYWGYKTKPKNLLGVNRPLLLGYKTGIPCFTLNKIEVMIRKSTRESNKLRLFNAYQKELDLI